MPWGLAGRSRLKNMADPDNKRPTSLDGGETTAGGILASFSPWVSRSATPRSTTPKQMPKQDDGKIQESPLSRGKDHTVSHLNRLSNRQYPPDCPPLVTQWYHAVDVPKAKPFSTNSEESSKPAATPKKYVPFSTSDSRAIEAAFQKMVDTEDSRGRKTLLGTTDHLRASNADLGDQASKIAEQDCPEVVTVSVNEDYLFDVNVEKRELAPAYWLGPVYDVRRGTWFFAGESRIISVCPNSSQSIHRYCYS